MVSWLDKASGLFQRSTAGGGESTRQPFQFTCDCGARITGLRESRFQQFPCDACGHVVFVLPENPYPKPGPARKKKSPEQPPDMDVETASIEAVDEETQANEVSDSPAPSTRQKKKLSGLDVNGGVRPRRKQESPPTDRPLAPAGIALPRRRFWTPLRTILAVVVTLVLATGLGLGWRWRVEQARVTWPAAFEQGMAAFGERNFVEAELALSRAKAAVDLLGKRDPEAGQIRARWREARAARGLAPFLLQDWLGECLTPSEPDEEASKDVVLDRIHGTWLVLDVPVVYEGEAQSPVADVLLLAGEHLIDVGLTLPDAVRRAPEDERPARLVVGAQVLRFVPTQTGGRLEFVPGSAFLWTDYDTYRVVTFDVPSEDEPILRELFAAQQRWEETDE